ncbi:MAG: PrsW family intramembrane metalloprotease [Chloroflexi bacterium]|nr:MAG: PrsW family intramembrane metalloprotease [Chloroflexota bacterium]
MPMQAAQQMEDARSLGIPPDLLKVTRSRRGVWIAGIVALLGLLAFVALFNFVLPPLSTQLQRWQLVLVGLVLSLVPAALWLLVFYQMDRLEPEPKAGLIKIGILAVLIYVAVAMPVLDGLFDIGSWLYDAWWTQLLGGILVVGMVQTVVTYATVRYGVYFSDEFDERVDGIIYGTAAGLGMATVLNFDYVFAHGGVDLDIGSIRMVVNALAYGSFGGILGYFLGQTRFEKTPWYYLPAGVLLVAVLDGVFFFVEDRVSASGLQVNPMNALLWAAVFAILSFAAVFLLVRRANEETLRLARSLQETAPAAPEMAPEPSPYAPPEPPPAPEVSLPASEEPPAPSPTALEPEAAVEEIVSRPEQGEELDEEEKQEILNELRTSWQALMEEEGAGAEEEEPTAGDEDAEPDRPEEGT